MEQRKYYLSFKSTLVRFLNFRLGSSNILKLAGAPSSGILFPVSNAMSRTSFDQIISLFLRPLGPRPSDLLIFRVVSCIGRGGCGIFSDVVNSVVAEVIGDGVVVDEFLRIVPLWHG